MRVMINVGVMCGVGQHYLHVVGEKEKETKAEQSMRLKYRNKQQKYCDITLEGRNSGARGDVHW
jgi:hypothetical protein